MKLALNIPDSYVKDILEISLESLEEFGDISLESVSSEKIVKDLFVDKAAIENVVEKVINTPAVKDYLCDLLIDSEAFRPFLLSVAKKRKILA